MAFPYKAGVRVREIAPPHRKGMIIRAVRTGTYARLFVQINGVGIVAFYPAQIALA